MAQSPVSILEKYCQSQGCVPEWEDAKDGELDEETQLWSTSVQVAMPDGTVETTAGAGSSRVESRARAALSCLSMLAGKGLLKDIAGADGGDGAVDLAAFEEGEAMGEPEAENMEVMEPMEDEALEEQDGLELGDDESAAKRRKVEPAGFLPPGRVVKPGLLKPSAGVVTRPAGVTHVSEVGPPAAFANAQSVPPASSVVAGSAQKTPVQVLNEYCQKTQLKAEWAASQTGKQWKVRLTVRSADGSVLAQADGLGGAKKEAQTAAANAFLSKPSALPSLGHQLGADIWNDPSWPL